MYRKNVAGQFVCVQLLLTASGAVATGLSPTVRRCIDGTFAAGGGTITEDSAGFYKYAMSQADTNGNDISFCVSATGAIPVCVNIVTTACDPTNAATFGITDIDATISSRATVAGIWQDTTAGDFTVAASIGKSVMNGVALGTGLTVNDITTKTGFALTSAYDFAKGTVAMTESYAANTVAPTPVQALYAIQQHLSDFAIVGVNYTVFKLDHVTTAYIGTLDSATTPTSQIRT